MALDAVVFPQDPFGYICSSFRDYFQGVDDEIRGESISRIMNTHSWSYEQLGFHEGNKSLLTILDNKNNTTFVNMQQNEYQWVTCSNSSPEEFHGVCEMSIEEQHKKMVTTRRTKRRLTKASKNKEEVENQRMTHIAVERNHRKLMNEYLAALRSLMPSSYAHKGDQASIIGGAINFVKQLEQLLQTLEANKSFNNNHQQEKAQEHSQTSKDQTFLSPFSNFFTFPQYTTTKAAAEYAYTFDDKAAAAAADIEVTIVESHANVKILAKRCPKQLVKLVSTFQNLKLNVQHLNVSSLDHMVLYSVSVKVEEGCKVNTVDEIAAAVNKMLHTIEEESRC